MRKCLIILACAVVAVCLISGNAPHRSHRVTITTADTTYTLTYSDFDGFLQTSDGMVYMRRLGDTLQVVVGNTQYNTIEDMEKYQITVFDRGYDCEAEFSYNTPAALADYIRDAVRKYNKEFCMPHTEE